MFEDTQRCSDCKFADKCPTVGMQDFTLDHLASSPGGIRREIEWYTCSSLSDSCNEGEDSTQHSL